MFFVCNEILEIPRTLMCIIECWKIAEKSLQIDIYNCYPDADEEFITRFFHGKFAAALMVASEAGFIRKAFLMDLNKAFPYHQNEMKQIADGLIAEVTLHKRATERITGGDIGLMIIRPKVEKHSCSFKVSDYKRGLLCQAKLKRASGKWGSFTKNQINILPERIQYLALLLYDYEDAKRSKLKPFSWQKCQSATMPEVQNWLKYDSFPELENSDSIITNLGYGNIGTDDENIIDELISTAGNPSLVIRITWPEGRKPGGPGSEIRIRSKRTQPAERTVINING